MYITINRLWASMINTFRQLQASLWRHSCFPLCYIRFWVSRKKLSLIHLSSYPKLSQLSCDPSKLQLMHTVQHAWDVQGLLCLLTWTTWEMKAKELLKISTCVTVCCLPKHWAMGLSTPPHGSPASFGAHLSCHVAPVWSLVVSRTKW